MSFDKQLLENLIQENKSGSCKFKLYLNDKDYLLQQVSIMNSPNPVNSPTTRGGVYFADKFAYKLKGTLEDLSVVPLLSKTMLGPNTEFGEIKITTEMDVENQKRNVIIRIQNSGSVTYESNTYTKNNC